jgi:hypothetical protein
MAQPMNAGEPAPAALGADSAWVSVARRAAGRAEVHVAGSLVLLVLDLVTGPHLMFPILFVVPVTFSAWFCGARLAVLLGMFLPVGRFFIATSFEHAVPPSYAVLNAVIRAAVLVFIGYLVARTARQTRELQREVKLLEGFLPVCSFCKKIRNERQEWEPMEQYISERSDAQFSHGLCPECLQKHYGEWVKRPPPDPRPGG